MEKVELRCSQFDKRSAVMNSNNQACVAKKHCYLRVGVFSFFPHTSQATCHIHFFLNVGGERLRRGHQSCNFGQRSIGQDITIELLGLAKNRPAMKHVDAL